jgi:hypothetical protein
MLPDAKKNSILPSLLLWLVLGCIEAKAPKIDEGTQFGVFLTKAHNLGCFLRRHTIWNVLNTRAQNLGFLKNFKKFVIYFKVFLVQNVFRLAKKESVISIFPAFTL